MDYRPHPLISTLFGLLLVLNAASVCLYALLLSNGKIAGFEAFHLAMSALSILIIVFFAIFYLHTHRRERPFKIPYVLAFGSICLANLLVSISVSVRAAPQFCYQFPGSDPQGDGCKWGGIAIIFPWITTIFSAGGLIVALAERHLRPIEVLTRKARVDVEHEIQEWQNGCFNENLKQTMANHNPGFAGAPDTFNPYSDFNIVIQHPEPIAQREIQMVSVSVLQPIEEEQSDEGHEDSLEEDSPDSIYQTPQNSTESIETDLGSHVHDQISIIAKFPPVNYSTTESNESGPKGEADEELDEEPPMPKRKRQLHRRILSGAVRPPKDFVIRFKEPVAVPVRESPPPETPLETQVLPSTVPAAVV